MLNRETNGFGFLHFKKPPNMDVELEHLPHSEGTRVKIIHQNLGVSKVQTQQTFDDGFSGFSPKDFFIPLHDSFLVLTGCSSSVGCYRSMDEIGNCFPR